MGNIDRQDLSVSVSISEEMSWHLHAADTFHFSHVGTQRAVRRSCFLPSADNCPATGNCPAAELFVVSRRFEPRLIKSLANTAPRDTALCLKRVSEESLSRGAKSV